MNKGKCSVCNSENVDYGISELDGEQIGYEIVCCDCGAKGMEWYNLVYSETCMK